VDRPDFSATRTACMVNCSFSMSLSDITTTATVRFRGLSILLWELLCLSQLFPYPVQGYTREVLSLHNPKSVALSPTKISSFPLQIKYKFGLRTSGIYYISWEHYQVYIEQRGYLIGVTDKEHHQHLHL
jgi:hypothetical protein